ncbi:MAG: small basic protein [Phycisphaerae bacterium]|nr:small basic protein [Phycisphaerae bacterium]
MSIHPSLKTTSGALNSHRNVLTRTERIEKLSLSEKFDLEKNPPLGLVKVRSIKASTGKKAKKAEGEVAEGTAAAPGAAPVAAAAGAKAPVAGAAGAKAAPAKDAGAAKKK